MDAAEKVSSGNVKLEEVSAASDLNARELLMRIKGVGPKVADCTLLFGFGRLSVFPTDVWIGRAMAEMFSGKSHEIFGEYAGIAQQYIFHFKRLNK
jgi:N-glycosylase/DNA lyase